MVKTLKHVVKHVLQQILQNLSPKMFFMKKAKTWWRQVEEQNLLEEAREASQILRLQHQTWLETMV